MGYCKKLGLHGAELTVNKRGYPPNGGGEVLFESNILKTVKPLQWLDPGKVQWEIYYLITTDFKQKTSFTPYLHY